MREFSFDERNTSHVNVLIQISVFLLQESAMFVCIVMEHYTQGDLGNLLRHKRQKSELIEELVSTN